MRLAALVVVLSAVAFAQPGPAPKQPAKKVPVQHVTFTPSDVDGEFERPGGTTVFGRPKAKFDRLFGVRQDFNDALRRSADSL